MPTSAFVDRQHSSTQQNDASVDLPRLFITWMRSSIYFFDSPRPLSPFRPPAHRGLSVFECRQLHACSQLDSGTCRNDSTTALCTRFISAHSGEKKGPYKRRHDGPKQHQSHPLYRGWRVSVTSVEDDIPLQDNSNFQGANTHDSEEADARLIRDEPYYETRIFSRHGAGSPNGGHSSVHCGSRGCGSTFCLQCIVNLSESEHYPHCPVCGQFMTEIGQGVWARKITEDVRILHRRTPVNHVVANIPAAHKLLGGYDEGASLLGLYNEYETKFWEKHDRLDEINVKITLRTREVLFPRFRDRFDSEDSYTIWQYARLGGVYDWAELHFDAEKTQTFFCLSPVRSWSRSQWKLIRETYAFSRQESNHREYFT